MNIHTLNAPRFIIEIPGDSKLSGGIQRMTEFHTEISKYYPCILQNFRIPIEIKYNDTIITFSDRPDIDDLCQRAKNKNATILVYQLSYGMCLERERKVVSHSDTIICTSTKKILKEIKKDIGDTKKFIFYIGHSQETAIKNFFPQESLVSRGTKFFDIAIMIHNAPKKRFQEAFEFCKNKQMQIVLFGCRNNNFDLSGAKNVYLNADAGMLRWIFNNSEKYLSFSETEGLNRIGVEAMLCGCKPYIFDGFEFYKNNINCKRIKKLSDIQKDFELPNYEVIKETLSQYTWKNTLDNLGKIIGVNFGVINS